MGHLRETGKEEIPAYWRGARKGEGIWKKEKWQSWKNREPAKLDRGFERNNQVPSWMGHSWRVQSWGAALVFMGN